MKKTFQSIFTVHRGKDSTDDGVALLDIFLQSSHEIIGKWLDNLPALRTIVVNGGHLPFGDAFKYSNAPSFFCLAAELSGSKNSGVLWSRCVFAIALDGTLAASFCTLHLI